MAKTKLVVTTPLGTFTRTTARTYSHLVAVKGYRAERLEAGRLAEIASARREAAKYRKIQTTGVDPTDASLWSREFTAQRVANGEFAQWAVEADARADALEARGPITADADGWSLHETNLDRPATWGVIGWCGRPDLAAKLAAQQDSYRHVAIVSVADGTVQEVR